MNKRAKWIAQRRKNHYWERIGILCFHNKRLRLDELKKTRQLFLAAHRTLRKMMLDYKNNNNYDRRKED